MGVRGMLRPCGFCVVPSRVFLFQPKAAQGRNRPCAAAAIEDV